MQLNQINAVGYLATDCKTREIPGQGGVQRHVVSARIALSCGFGEKREAHYIEIATFEDIQKGRAAQFWRKGVKLYIRGELRIDQWEDKDGNKREKASVRVFEWQFAENKAKDGDGNPGPSKAAKPAGGSAPKLVEPDDIPF